MSALLGHAVTVGDVLLFGLGWLTLRGLLGWRRHIAWQHSTDGGAEGRRLRATGGGPR